MSDTKWEVKTKSKRLCRLYFKYLNERNISINYDPSLTAQDQCSRINNKIKNISNGDNQEKRRNDTYLIIRNMKSHCSRDFIDDKKIDWIVGNDKACAIAWIYIRKYEHIRIKRLHNDFKTKYAYDLMWLPRKAMNTKDRLDFFTEFLDDIDLDLREKHKILDDIKDVYSKSSIMNKKAPWFNKDNERSLSWAWEYLNKKIKIPHYLKHSELNEQYLSIYSIFSYWNDSYGDRELFLYKMSSAWRQVKNRDDNTNNKRINTYIGSEYKKYLDELAKHYKSTFRGTLEIAIKNEYDREMKK